ncbi:MAG: hypothetical protein MUO67_05165, partial [Anaerolineales bacterium]|nr:hypothetical protein [Anaerolineales bacterium]
MKCEKESGESNNKPRMNDHRIIRIDMRNRSKIFLYSLRALLLLGIFFFQNTGISAQGTSPIWRNPIDMTQASTSSNALFPLILCDQYQNTHILWSDRFEESTLYYMNDISGD